MAWPRRRRLFLLANLGFTALMIVGVVLIFALSGLGARLVVVACLFAIMVANLVLRFTYFRNVLPEIREERERLGTVDGGGWGETANPNEPDGTR